ncbi:MAG: SigE family RNA polymerase sigma factor [Actinomycetota bacterium]|nr:SigE family RNA polymerase sigma factor [Actinomycetota bacterium]
MDIDEYRQEREALHIAYRRHYAPLVRFCALLAADHATAEDIVQDVFVRGGSRIVRLPETAQLPYLRRAVTNEWKNRQRRRVLDLRVARFRVGASTTGDETAGASDRHVDLWAAILRLPPKQRACLVLRYYEDLTEAETASVLGVRVGTVKSQVSRALSKLREVVER